MRVRSLVKLPSPLPSALSEPRVTYLPYNTSHMVGGSSCWGDRFPGNSYSLDRFLDSAKLYSHHKLHPPDLEKVRKNQQTLVYFFVFKQFHF